MSILGEYGDKVIKELGNLISGANKTKKKQHYADCIVQNANGDILLLKRAATDDFQPDKWALPGGKIEENEKIEVAALRELEEETAISFTQLDSFCFIKTIVKDDAVINYFSAVLKEDAVIVLDNDEHFQSEFVPIRFLPRYDLLLDLQQVLKEQIIPLLGAEDLTDILPANDLEVVAPEPDLIKLDHGEIIKCFDDGLIDADDYLKYEGIKKSLELITKGYDQDLVSDDKFFDALEKAKHFEFVKVVRDGKQFYQYREVGTDKIQEDVETGTTIETSAMLDLKITKYSDKSILISGNTYKNLQLLREAKNAAGGYGTFNKSLNGWIFPLFAKDKIMALFASKMTIETYDETSAKDAAIDLKNSVDVGTEVTVGGESMHVTETTIDETSNVGYKVEIEGQWEKDKVVTEEEIAIPSATEEKAEELINNATEENRFKTGKQLFGKEEGEKPVSDDIEKEGEKEIKIEVKEFTTRSGEKLNALDYTDVKQDNIQLTDIESILDKERPYYIPEINEYMFSGHRDDKFIFDYVKMQDGNFLISLNGYKDSYSFNADKRYKKVDPAYAVMSLDNLVATTEYYKAKRKAEIKREVDIRNKEINEKYASLTDEQIEKYKAFNYLRLSGSQQKKITADQWNNLPKDEKLKWVDGMSSPVYARKTQKRIKVLEDDTMLKSNFDMYKQYVDKEYKTPFDLGKRYYTADDPCVMEYSEAREQIKWKRNDLQIQREENDSSYLKGKETSYGDSNTSNHLLDSHGVKIKSQNGKELGVDEIDQIKSHLTKVYESFGDRSSMAKEFGLKISHAREKKMHASKFLGIYIPSMRAIGVSDDPLHGKFGLTLAHEFSHFIDNYAGKKQGRYFASDAYGSLAHQIADSFRKNMNKKSESNYINRTCECFARSFEQYHAMKHNGEDAVKYAYNNIPYHEDPNHVSKETFNSKIKPLIEQFLQENDHLLKSAFGELNLIDLNNNFELIKAAFDEELIDTDTYLSVQQKYDQIVKGDPSHGGKLVKKVAVNKLGKKETKWVKRGDAGTDDTKASTESNEPVRHSTNVLGAFAKETSAAELKRVINESSDEKLRAAAHAELDRREKKEKPQEPKFPADRVERGQSSDKIKKLATKKDDSKPKPIEKLPSALYRGGENLTDERITKSGVSFSTHKHIADDFTKNKGGETKEYKLSKSAKILDFKDIPDVKFKDLNDYSSLVDTTDEKVWAEIEKEYQKAVDYVKENGFDGIKLPLEGEIRVVNKDVILESE